MSSETLRFDEAWFAEERRRLSERWLSPEAQRHQRMRMPRVLDMRPRERKEDHGARDRILDRMPPTQGAALHSHLAIFQGCLESAGLMPAYDIVQELLLVEWLWHTSPFKKFYRDHLAHVLKVSGIAVQLLRVKAWGPPSRAEESLADWLGQGLAEGRLGSAALRTTARRLGVKDERLQEPDFWTSAVREATRVGCLLHDLGYAAQIQQAMASQVHTTTPFGPLPLATRADEQWLWQNLEHHLLALPFTALRA